MRCWLALVVLAGCWSERAPSPAAPASIAAVERPREPWPSSTPMRFTPRVEDRCATVIGHVFELARQDASNGRFTAAMLDELLQVTIESCHETQWSEESLDCYEETTSSSDTSDCYSSMTMEQREDFERRFTEVMQRHRSPMMAPPPSP
jgi:hypothetical protein